VYHFSVFTTFFYHKKISKDFFLEDTQKNLFILGKNAGFILIFAILTHSAAFFFFVPIAQIRLVFMLFK
jgi:hypothetical protein